MVGYSDSAKDIGRLAAAWELYKAQEAIVDGLPRARRAVTLFHGRGGSVGRGGGPTSLAIQSQPPGSVDGTLRVTEQGEMIQAKFGLPGIALRTLEVYTTATLEATLAPAARRRPALARDDGSPRDAARRAFRQIVYDDPRFPTYFRAATPDAELDALHIGSRPGAASRRAALARCARSRGSSRGRRRGCCCASWLGAEEIGASTRDDREHVPRDVPRVAVLPIDARSHGDGAREGRPRDRRALRSPARAAGSAGPRRRAARAACSRDRRRVRGHRPRTACSRTIRCSGARSTCAIPYVDPINLLQVELLRRLRDARDANAEETVQLRRALIVTINGIAAGMRNTG